MQQPDEARSWWSIVRAALRGEAHDYTRGSLTRAIWLLAIPMVLEMAMESTFAIVDCFFVAKLGDEAVATVAQQVELNLVPGARVDMETTLTLRPRGGLWMTVKGM